MRDWVKNELKTGKIKKIYDITLKSLFDRQEEDGYFPESYTGKYDGAFIRSIGAQSLFLTEMEMYDKAENIMCQILEIIKEFNLPRIPHWYSVKDLYLKMKKDPLIDMEDQIDGTGHIILAYATLCLEGNRKEFEDKYYDYMCTEMIKAYSYPYFMDKSEKLPKLVIDWDNFRNWINTVVEKEPILNKDALNLVRNFHFEGTRKAMCECYEILGQSFIGAAADKMLELAKRRKDNKFANWLSKKIEIHTYGLNSSMTFIKDGKKMYYELLMPGEKEGEAVPVNALGWPLFALNVATKWKSVDYEIYNNTMEYMIEKTTLKDPVTNTKINMCQYEEDGHIFTHMYSKIIGWTIEYFMSKNNWERVADWIKFINVINTNDLLSEKFEPLFENGEPISIYEIDKRTINFDNELPDDIKWKIEDGGNGEQSIWFCRAIYRLMKELDI